MEVTNFSDDDDEAAKTEFDNLTDYKEILRDFPEVIEYISKLHDHIRWQRKKINKLRNKLTGCKKAKLLSNNKLYLDSAIQTDSEEVDKELKIKEEWRSVGNSEIGENIVDQVTKAAESAIQQTGFVYEETSGLYYDYNTGYYYDAEQRLYYDGNSGTYYCYDEETKSYKFHSRTTQVPSNDGIEKKTKKRKEKRKARKANKVSDEINQLITGLSDISIERCRQQALGNYDDDDNSCDDEHEEGECSASDNSLITEDLTYELSSSNDSENEGEKELAKTYPPCMRIIVKETSLPKLKSGSLFVVTYTGGSMGREGDHSVLIQDINISKQHARFQYDETKKHYELIDLGSRNGTLLNGKRLSVAKQESEPYEIVHGSIIQVGGTKLLCHIHHGHETCGHCEPGLLQESINTEGSSICRKNQHKSELRRLKLKFGVEKDNANISSQAAAGYRDRAQARRVAVGSHNHHAKTQQSSVDESIARDNKGFKLLSKMGWSEGQSLGKDGDGRTEPVPLVSNHNKAGLGASDSRLPMIEANPSTEKRQAVWKKTRQRYQEIPDEQN